MVLNVDIRWCAKCAICRAASQGRMRFDAEGYPLAGPVEPEAVEFLEIAVTRCPIGALRLA